MSQERTPQSSVHRRDEPMDVLVAGDVPAAPGSRQFACADCGHAVWVAPSGQHRLKLNKRAKIICIDCLLEMNGEPVLKRPTAAEILLDLSGTN